MKRFLVDRWHLSAAAFGRGRGRRALASPLLAAALALLTAIAPVSPAWAEIPIRTTPDGGEGEAGLATADGQIQLTLEEALEIALRRNLGLAIQRLARQQFRLGVDQARGIFDLRLGGFTQWSESSSATASALEGAAVRQDEQQIFNLGLAQLTPIGGDLSLDFNNSRLKTNSAFFDLNPSYNVGLDLTYNLPLLRNFGPLATKRGILVARVQSAGNLAFFEAQVVTLIQSVENGYWDLVEAIEQLGVAEEGLRLAEELHRRNQVQVEVGTLPPLELVQSEANIATRQEEIIRARTAVGDAADRLRLLLNVEQGPAWEMEIVPTTDPGTEAVDISLAQAIETALQERPELAQQELEVERLTIEDKFFRNQTRPRLDMGLSYGLTGVGGELLTEDPDTGEPVSVPGGWSDAFDQVKDADFDNWSVSLTFAYPLQNRSAKVQSMIASLDLESGRTRLNEIEQQVITEVRTAVRGVTAALQQIESAGVSRRLQERNLDAEQKRYENGMSTSFQVTQIQEDLTLAKSREVTAIASYRRALTEYHRAVGKLLEETGVVLMEPATRP